MPLDICFDNTFMRKLTLEIFYKFVIIVEYILSIQLFIYLMILWLITKYKDISLEIKRFDE